MEESGASMSFNRCNQTSAVYRDSKERNQCVIRFSVLHSFYTAANNCVHRLDKRKHLYRRFYLFFATLFSRYAGFSREKNVFIAVGIAFIQRSGS